MRLYKMYFITLWGTWLFERVIVLFLKVHGQVVMMTRKLIVFHRYININLKASVSKVLLRRGVGVRRNHCVR